ncbi:hypothetical protein AMAG_18222 [Allomyces macrogynus ATCC 38327]|uniref:Uncharacterized protein n=1 Tax=Allomyces macrogynus (strain ATCC 38327) TaxID=578462 RepID=A0A0L0SAN0_ALLM3|nr:hypothetical protein AMAG_18222 [Allomyces macrogynus ATCC 38327]|eukprot:KNE59638.1 hypothetical protein AMAG_18222 [Allomyces macrogynus ATCC 38327]
MLFTPPDSSDQVAIEEMQVEVSVDDGLVAREEEAVEIPSTTPSLPTTPATEVPEPNLAMLSPPPSPPLLPPLLPPRHHHVAHFHHHHGMPTVIHRRTKPLPTTPPRSPTTTAHVTGDSPSPKSSSMWSIGRAWRRLTRRRSSATATVRRRSSTASIPEADPEKQWWANLGREQRTGPQERFAPSLGADDDGEDLHLVLAAGLFVHNLSPAYLAGIRRRPRWHNQAQRNLRT